MYTSGSCALGYQTFVPGPRLVFRISLSDALPLGGTLHTLHLRAHLQQHGALPRHGLPNLVRLLQLPARQRRRNRLSLCEQRPCQRVDTCREFAHLLCAAGQLQWRRGGEWVVLELSRRQRVTNKHAHAQPHGIAHAHAQRQPLKEPLTEGQTCCSVTGDIPFGGRGLRK